MMEAQGVEVVDLPGTPVRALAFATRLPLWVSRPLLGACRGRGRGGKMPSFHIDLHSGRGQSEVEYLHGAVVRSGQNLGVPTPVNKALTETLLALTPRRAGAGGLRRAAGEAAGEGGGMTGRASLFLGMALLPLLAACTAAPCERPVSAGYIRHTLDGLPLRFDAPADWELKDGPLLARADASGAGRSVLVEFHSKPVENYPHIYSEGQILTDQEWGSPFPGRVVDIAARELDQGGHPGLTVAFDFESPLTLMDGTSPVTDWGYMQFTFLVVEPTMLDIRFHASDQGQEKQIRREFDRLVESICVMPEAGADND